MAMDRLATAVDVLHLYFELGNETSAGPTATFVRSTACPRVYDANCVTRVRAATEAEIEALMAEADRRFADREHRCFKLDPLTPPAFEARLIVDGYDGSDEVQLLLDGDLRVSKVATDIEIRPVLNDEDWVSLRRLMRSDHVETTDRRDEDTWADDVTDQMLVQKQRKAAEIQFFLARAHGEDCAFFSSWPGRNGIGKVEDLFTLPNFRHRGIASALIVHAVADARARGAGPVIIGAEADDTPKRMYAAMGFRPLLVYRSYVRT